MTGAKTRAVHKSGWVSAVAVGAAAAAFLTPAYVSAQTPDLARQAAYSADQAEAGAVVYQASCMGCHLPNLAGSFEALGVRHSVHQLRPEGSLEVPSL